MRYEIGNMDRYFIVTNNTVLENAAFFTIEVDELINKDKLLNSINKSLLFHPLFKTKVIYDKKYYLETNEKEIILDENIEENRIKEFGKLTNDYPWRITYYQNKIYFEWCHIITDGHGALDFLTTLINIYYDDFNDRIPDSFPLNPGLESCYDKSTKGLKQKHQEKGFKKSSLPLIKNGFKCNSHLFSIETKDLLKVSKKYDTTPVAILAPLYSRAIRKAIPKTIKNRNVNCVILIDIRKIMDIKSMHNAILTKGITYYDRFDELSLETLGTIYRSILDLYIDKDNIKKECTKLIDSTNSLYNLRPLFLNKLLMKVAAKYIKDNMNNIYITYLGRCYFNENSNKHIKKVHFRSWPDTGYSSLAVLDFNGTLYCDFCENYKNKEVLNYFIDILNNEGIKVDLLEEREFIQSHFKRK